jgi:ribosome-associated protein
MLKYITVYKINTTDLLKELSFRTSRSSGKGGQNVNKVSTKVSLIFEIEKSSVLNGNLKKIILEKLKSHINSKGLLQITVSKERYQHVNKSIAVKKFLKLIEKALEPETERIKTNPTRASKEKRLHNKANISVKKRLRLKNKIEEE